ncbi:hypothetical protein NQ317_015441, partial [Molorchus minor]
RAGRVPNAISLRATAASPTAPGRDSASGGPVSASRLGKVSTACGLKFYLKGGAKKSAFYEKRDFLVKLKHYLTGDPGIINYLCVLGYTHSISNINITREGYLALCNLDCGSHGQCDMGKCRCDPGWTGARCEQLPCDVRCQEHGQCRNGTCVCSQGWNGRHCTLPGCENGCSGHGQCTLEEGLYKCVCIQGWAGSDCSIPLEQDCQDDKDNDDDEVVIAAAQSIAVWLVNCPVFCVPCVAAATPLVASSGTPLHRGTLQNFPFCSTEKI